MSVTRHPSLQTVALFLALFAVTLNFLQPLAHAAWMRSGEPGTRWSVSCVAANADPDRAGTDRGSTSIPASSNGIHECCLGLAHAPPLLAPYATFITLAPIEIAPASSLPVAQRPSIAIRDGPTRPRGPPPSPMT